MRAAAPALAALTAFCALWLCGCMASTPSAVRAIPQAADFPERRLILVFENESSFTPLTGRRVKIQISSPATLITPADGSAVTGSGGEVEVTYRPVAVYSENALNAGDIVAEFPAILNVSMELGDDVLEWQVDDTLYYARYSDPLYQGLDRDPDPGPYHINLYFIP
jgi:hypothetical protein